MNENLKEIIQKSGNNLHLEVVKSLEELGWSVNLSSYYYDDITDKPREIDIVANKRISIYGDRREKEIDYFFVYLFIECKHFKDEIAFRLHKNNLGESGSAILTEVFNREEILRGTGLESKHHYLTPSKIAKLYDTKDQKEVFDAITSPVKSLISFRRMKVVSVKAIYYPIVVYRGIPGIYLIKDESQLNNLDDLSQSDQTLFGLNYVYNTTGTHYFCLDFIRQNKLEGFLREIQSEEIKKIKDYLEFEIQKSDK